MLQLIAFFHCPSLERRFPEGQDLVSFRPGMWSARELLFERTHSLGSTALALVWVLPRVSHVPLRMFCTLGDSTCLSRSSASPSVNEDHRCDAECDASSTDVPHRLIHPERTSGRGWHTGSVLATVLWAWLWQGLTSLCLEP